MKTAQPRTKTFGLFLLPIFLSFVFVACQKDEPEPGPGEPASTSLSVSVAEAAPYQYIRIQLPPGAKPQSTTAKIVSVTIGTVKVDAYADEKALSSNTYAYFLLLPELPADNQKISLTIADGKVAEGSIKLKTFTRITDVPLYIKNQLDNAQKEVNDAKLQYNSQVQAGYMRPATRDSLNTFLQQSYDKNKAIVDALPEDEKRIYAQLIEANKSWLNDYKQVFIQNPLSTYRVSAAGDCEELRRQQMIYAANGFTDKAKEYELKANQCEAEREQKRVEATSVFSGKMKEAYEAANEERKNTNGRLKAGWAFVSTFATEAFKGMFETATGIVDLDDPFALLQIDDTKQQRSMAQEFELDKEYQYSAGLSLVNMNSQNASSFPVFTGIISGINNYNSAMTDIAQFLPFAPAMKVPDAKSVKAYVSGYTVDQVSDSRINVEIKDGSQGNLIKFSLKTPVVEEAINFTFRVNYTSKFGNGSKQVSATLKLPLDKMLLKASPFKITRWVQGGVDLFTMHEIWRWTCGQTEYINKEQLLDATLGFAADGTYTMSEKYHEIYYDNPGTTCATVRKVDQEKTYSSTSTWSAANATKMLTVTFKDDQGQNQTLTAPAVIQDGTLTISAGGVTISMQKK